MCVFYLGERTEANSAYDVVQIYNTKVVGGYMREHDCNGLREDRFVLSYLQSEVVNRD